MSSHWLAGTMLAIAIAAGSAFPHSAVYAQASAPGQAAPVPNPNPSSSAIAMAKDLITLKGAHQMFDAIVPGVIETAKNSFIPTNPNLSKELNEVSAQLRKDFDSKKAEVMNEVARVYARHFTEQELKELLAFYRTALGKKVLAEEPLAIDEAVRRARQWADTFSDQVMSRMRAEMKKKGFDL